MPTLAKMILDQVAKDDALPTKNEADDADAFIDENYRNELY